MDVTLNMMLVGPRELYCLSRSLLPLSVAVEWIAAVTFAAGTAALGYLAYKKFYVKDTRSKGMVNLHVQKDNPKVVHAFDMEDLGDKAVYCRCWRSKKVSGAVPVCLCARLVESGAVPVCPCARLVESPAPPCFCGVRSSLVFTRCFLFVGDGLWPGISDLPSSCLCLKCWDGRLASAHTALHTPVEYVFSNIQLPCSEMTSYPQGIKLS